MCMIVCDFACRRVYIVCMFRAYKRACNVQNWHAYIVCVYACMCRGGSSQGIMPPPPNR